LRFARENMPLGLARRLPPVGLHDALWWALAGAIAVLGAILLWMIVTPVSPLGPWKPAGVRVMSPAARSALFAGFDPFNRTAVQVAAAGPGTVTGLALTLFGVRVTAATGGGTAIIAGADGIQQVYRVGTEVMPGVTLSGVHFDHVELAHNGANELLYLDQSKPAPSAATALEQTPAGPVGQTAPVAPAAPPLSAEALREGIAFIPRSEGGRITGLAVGSSGDGAAFRAAGFQPGDVIVGVGGRPVSTAADGASLNAQLRSGQPVAVTVRRNGQQLPLAIAAGR
jgi:general secretion pathway protein C